MKSSDAFRDVVDFSARPDQFILLLADPGTPARHAAAIRAQIQTDLEVALNGPVLIQPGIELVRLRANDTVDHPRLRRSPDHDLFDAVIVLTEIPRYTSKHPLVAEAHTSTRLLIVSTPTLGPWNIRRRLRAVVCAGAAVLDGQAPPDTGRFSSTRRWEPGPLPETHVLLDRGLMSWNRLVGGMTRANAPLRTAPKLSGVLAAASAAGAFGLFFTSIWQMAARLPSWRLLTIAVLAVTVLMGWLFFNNRLWDTAVSTRLVKATRLYNLSTVVTLMLCVMGLYLSLFAAILTGAIVLIDPQYLSEALHRPADVADYLRLAWLSATMGVVAGGLGSTFDSADDIHQLTHGRRERHRLTPPADVSPDGLST